MTKMYQRCIKEYQSAYGDVHSTKMALLRVHNYLVCKMENQRTTVLLALDISAAFDTIDFNTLFDRLRLDFGLGSVALDWLRSFLIGRTQYVGVGISRTSPVTCLSGVPQGFGPLLFAMYISPVDKVVAAHRVHLHQCADDTQLYVALRPSHVSPFDFVSHCVSDISRWFLEKRILLNPSRLLDWSSSVRNSCTADKNWHVRWGRRRWNQGCIQLYSKLLGVTLDEDLSLDRHVTDIVRGCSYYTIALRDIRPLINLSAARIVAQRVVTSRLDYCNSLLYGTSTRNVERLQVAQNSLARLCVKQHGHQAPPLHWLPVKQRVYYKVAVIVYKTRSTAVPFYLSPLIKNYEPRRSLRSSDRLVLAPTAR